jgi:hypothetical protein
MYARLCWLQERTVDRDTPISVSSYFAQLKACRRRDHDESTMNQDPATLSTTTTCRVGRYAASRGYRPQTTSADLVYALS